MGRWCIVGGKALCVTLLDGGGAAYLHLSIPDLGRPGVPKHSGVSTFYCSDLRGNNNDSNYACLSVVCVMCYALFFPPALSIMALQERAPLCTQSLLFLSLSLSLSLSPSLFRSLSLVGQSIVLSLYSLPG